MRQSGNGAEQPGQRLQWRAETGRVCSKCLDSGDWCEACQGRRQEKQKQLELELGPESFDFGDLGPPPPCPLLCRQKATDLTASREAKRAGFFSQGPPVMQRQSRRLPMPTDHCPVMM